jgi:diguanylate cyclase (GGDEF)-like protein/PAS domain S-box-containing protein
MIPVFNCLIYDHDGRLVALAAAVCLLTSLVAIGLFYRARAARGFARPGWLVLDAVAAGYGIWATHFVSMLAYNPAIKADYDLALTLLSLLFAMFVTGLGLHVALSGLSRRRATIGGAIVGGGIAVMHFTGMLALELPGHLSWSIGLAAASVVFGIGFASLAFNVMVRREDVVHALVGAGSLAAATVMLHFTAMDALILTPDPTRVITERAVSPASLAIIIGGGAAILLGMCIVAALFDQRSEGKLRYQKALLDAALQNVSQGVCMFDAEGRVAVFNERYAKLMGYATESLRGRSLLDLLEERKSSGEFAGRPQEFFEQVMTEIRSGKSRTKVMESTTGRIVRVMEQPLPGGGWVATFEDITDQQRADAQILRLARHDALTGLLNRAVLTEELGKANDRYARDGEQFTIMMLDLDKFKTVNDTLGHHAGDQLLIEVARRLKASIRGADILARLGGDEFAIIMDSALDQNEASISLALRIINALSRPFDLDGQLAHIGASVGIALAPADGADAENLLRKADLALYAAKVGGRNTYRFYQPAMLNEIQTQQAAESELQEAIAQNEFELHYQPMFDVRTGELAGMEALVHWRHPGRGLIAPDQFMKLAQSSGLIVPLGNWILRQACTDAFSWPAPTMVAVNVSAMQFRNADMFNLILQTLSETGLSPGRLELEITEASLLEGQASNLAVIRQIKNLGVSLALDNFGTGHSSIHCLVNFPFDKIKIDKSFTQGCLDRRDYQAVISSVLALAKGLDILSTAEGVESSEQLEYLRAAGVDCVQGHLFAAPALLPEFNPRSVNWLTVNAAY